jgi:hypothetical protein
MYRVAVHIGLCATGIFASEASISRIFSAITSKYDNNAFIMQGINGLSAIPTLFILVIVSLLISCITLIFLLFTLLKNRRFYHTHSEDQPPFTDELDLLDGPTLTVVEGNSRSDQI